MKKKQSVQPPKITRRSNEEILEAMRQAIRDQKDDPEINEIFLRLMTFTPEKDAVDKAIVDIVALNYKKFYDKKYGT